MLYLKVHTFVPLQWQAFTLEACPETFPGIPHQEKPSMFRLVIQWVLSTIVLMILIRVVPGFFAENLYAAILVAVGIGFANAILGIALKQMSFPLAIVLCAVFAFGANVGLLVLCSSYVDGFYVYNLDPALWASGALTALIVILRFAMKNE